MIFGLVWIICAGYAQADTPKISDVAKARLLSSYKSILIAQQNFYTAQAQLQARVAQYNELLVKTRKEANLPDATVLTPDVDKDDVDVKVPPPATPEKK